MHCAGQLRVIDPLVLDLHCEPKRTGSRRLTSVCARYQVPLTQEQAHTAAADALAAARLTWCLGQTHRPLAHMSLDELPSAQVRWKAEQAAARQTRLRREVDPAAVVSPGWPLQLQPQAA